MSIAESPDAPHLREQPRVFAVPDAISVLIREVRQELSGRALYSLADRLGVAEIAVRALEMQKKDAPNV